MQTSHLSLKIEGSSPLRCYLLLQSICPEEKIFSRCDGIVLYLASHTVVMMMMIKEGEAPVCDGIMYSSAAGHIRRLVARYHKTPDLRHKY